MDPTVRPMQHTAVRADTLDVGSISAWLGSTFELVSAVVAQQGRATTGPPFARYHLLDGGRFRVEAGFPVSAPITSIGDVLAAKLPGGSVVTTLHVGRYDDMAPAYTALRTWVWAHQGTPDGDAWEVYLTDPGSVPDPADWCTEIVQPYTVI
jgi:effector-binding domain-containing protein